ncbi:MAG: hypothetical protein KC421_12665, partial [Anaerolineales bacterium]|nr:hypothetical protein [Anaerolineales bacterium]
MASLHKVLSSDMQHTAAKRPFILTTKLYTPKPRGQHVSRPHLIDHLNTGLDCKLTIISAPAGFGKTTLVAEWLQQISAGTCQSAWLSLDKVDNEPMRFLTYLITALQSVQAGLGGAALAWLQSANQSPIESLLTGLINEIMLLDSHIVFILDDFHVITEPVIHDIITFLLDNQPPNLHLLMITRADPPWPLARLRSQQALNEIRAKELRFTLEETAVFFNRLMQFNLSPDELTTLDAQIEGWVAGLQMVALSMKGHMDTAGFIKAFAGSHRFILDYLVEEVLDQQPPDIQKFLLQSAILDQLTAPLCNAITNRTDSQAVLTQLEQENLFISALDDERLWFRYHHLFADLLRSRLEQLYPEQIQPLHLAAGQWYEANGYLLNAVSYGLAAGNIEHVIDLIEGKALSMMGNGGLTTLIQWLDLLPDEVIETHPWLSVTHAWALVYTGHLDDAALPLQYAQEALNQIADDGQEDHRHVSGHLAAIQAYIAELKGEMQQAADLARRAQALLPEDALLARGSAASVLGAALRWLGDFPGAINAFTEAGMIQKLLGDNHISMFIQCGLARLYVLQGKLHQALALFETVIDDFEESTTPGMQKSPLMGYAHTRMSQLFLEWHEPDAALAHAQEGLRLSEQWGQADVLFYGYAHLAHALQANGCSKEALAIIFKAKEIATNMSPWFEAYASAWETRLRLAQGDIQAAVQWAQTNDLSIDDPISYHNEPLYYTLACTMVAQAWTQPGKLLIDDTEHLINRLLHLVERAGMMGRMIDLLVLQALLFQLKGNNQDALASLRNSLNLAESEGYLRVFIEAGDPICNLLHQAAEQHIQVDFVNRLLAVIDGKDEDEDGGKDGETAVPSSQL